jgi:hypothetical protein
MNRHQRRAAVKKPSATSAAQPVAGGTQPGARVGLVLRLVARVLLSAWVLRRVRNPDVMSMLVQVAEQAGRPEIALDLRERIRQAR